MRPRRWMSIVAVLVGLAAVSGCAYLPHVGVYWGGLELGESEVTRASWIAEELRGRVGAFGEAYNPEDLTAAHPTLPYGTFVRVTNLDNGRGAIVRVNDRASERAGKRLFLSKRAAEQLDMVEKGVAKVRVEPILAQEGVASWYGSLFHGRPTASGEIYDQTALTAAHRFLPFGTIVRVTSVDTNRSVLVRINDRGGFIKGRVIDLSRRAAREIGILKQGTGLVRIEIIRPPAPNGRPS